MKTTYLVGSRRDCDIVIRHPHVSGQHCRFERSGKQLQLIDLGSANGTFVNGSQVTSPVAVSPKDTITLGPDVVLAWQTVLSAIQGAAAAPAASKAAWANPVTAGSKPRGSDFVLGRDSGCGLVLDCPRVGPRHARLLKSGDQMVLEDLGTPAGTFVNGQCINGRVTLAAGDVVGIGSYRFEVSSEGRFRRRDFQDQDAIEARDISVDVPGRRLLDGVSLSILPAEFVGLMGPSGAGKTTLMNALNGYCPPTSGTVLIGGHDLYVEYARFAGKLGYVPQDDIMHRELTVGQALHYTAQLRFPPETPAETIETRIADVLRQLNLESTVDTRIGSPERKGISGGQRKRVNLAMELLTDPAVLFLDEPTSGLSSEDTRMVMSLLRSMADRGKSILLTIHQPSLEAFRLLDNLAVVARDSTSDATGQLVYYGPAYPDAPQFFQPSAQPGPEQVLSGLASKPVAEWRDRYEASAYKQRYVTSRAGRYTSAAVNESPLPDGLESLVAQTSTLIRRALAIKISDRWNTAILLAQAPVVAVLVSLVFGKDARQTITAENWGATTGATATAVFLLSLAALWFGCSNSVREIVAEWAIYHRERMVNLRIPAYITSKLVISGGLCVVQCAVLLAAGYGGCGLKAPPAVAFCVLLMTAGAGVGLGLILSALARSQEVAIALLPLVLIPMVIFGGVLLPVHRMQTVIRPLAYLMPTRYGFEALLASDADHKPLGPSPYSGTISAVRGGDDPDRPDMAENFFPRNTRLGLPKSLAALGVLLFAEILAVQLVLRYRDVH